ncbi:MAG: acyloxyacyl hydrolase [Lysobacter sp.]
MNLYFRFLVFGSLLVLGSMTSLRVNAETSRIEFQAGPSYMDNHGANAAFVDLTLEERPIGDSAWRWSPDFLAGWIDGRDVPRHRDDRYTTRDDIGLVAAGVRLRYGVPGTWLRHLFFSFQPVLHTGRTQALSSGYAFASTLGWQGRRISVQVRHISNGSLHAPNRGETMVLLGLGFDP